MTSAAPAKHGILAWLLRALLLLPAVALLVAAWPRFVSGLADAVVFPVPFYIASDTPAPRSAYLAMAEALADAPRADAETQIARAQALNLGGGPSEDVRSLVEQALARAPTSAGGWTLLAETAVSNDRVLSARALQLALDLGPLDNWLGGRRARVGALLWGDLSDEVRANLLRQTRLLWMEPTQRVHIRQLLATAGGPELVTRAFATDRDELRALNRWIGWVQYRDAIYPR